MTEKKQKANPNYEASAVNLTNPPDAGRELERLHSLQTLLDNLLITIESSISPNLKERRNELEKGILDAHANLKTIIDEQGSYQDIERGMYALKQKRVSITYAPFLTRQTIGDQLANIVIEPVVNKEKLHGLVKGGLVSEEQLGKCGSTTESFSYIIR